MVQICAPGALDGLVPPSSDLSGAAGTFKAAHSSLGHGLVEGTRGPGCLSQASCLLAMRRPAGVYFLSCKRKLILACLPHPAWRISVGNQCRNASVIWTHPDTNESGQGVTF